MKYYVIYTANGNLAINEITEYSNKEQAIAKFHDVCKLMWSDASVNDACVTILDEQLNVVDGHKESVHKAQAEVTKKSTKKEN